LQNIIILPVAGAAHHRITGGRLRDLDPTAILEHVLNLPLPNLVAARPQRGQLKRLLITRVMGS
jgi:hypothetical protein